MYLHFKVSTLSVSICVATLEAFCQSINPKRPNHNGRLLFVSDVSAGGSHPVFTSVILVRNIWFPMPSSGKGLYL